ESGQRVVVGVNRYGAGEETAPPILRIDPALERAQAERVAALRERRDAAAVERALGRLRADAAGEARLVAALVSAARAHAARGEMCDTLREVWGVWRETPVF